MRNWMILVAVFMVSALILSMIMPQDALGSGNERKGKFYFKKVCKDCHSKDGKGGELTPMSKTSTQWEAFFSKGQHGEKTLKDIVEEENIEHIKTFLINHAADSDQPETCG